MCLDVEGLLGTQLRGVGATDVTIAANMHTSATVTLHTPTAQSDMGDMGVAIDGGDAAVEDLSSDDMPPVCLPSCENATTLRSCTDAGVETCTLGCTVGHCAVFVPTAPVTRSDLELTGLSDFTSAGTAFVFDTDTGLVTAQGTFRAANDAPYTKLQIIGGIGFQVVGGVGIFIFQSMFVQQSQLVIVTGSNPGAFVTTGDLRIDGTIDVRPYASATLCAAHAAASGPGGGAGGEAGYAGLVHALDGAGPGGGGGGGGTQSGSSSTGGGGGAGHGDVGGVGDGTGGVQGKPGVPYTTSLGGSGGGGAGKGATNNMLTNGPTGGGGGGAIQLVAGGLLSIGTSASAGGVNAGGCGGESSGFGGGGGSGGSILIEAAKMLLDAHGILAANGGGGGGPSTNGAPGALDGAPASGGDGAGGNGGAASSCQGVAAQSSGGGGGGSAGVIVINESANQAKPAVGFIVSPALGMGCSSTGSITTK